MKQEKTAARTMTETVTLDFLALGARALLTGVATAVTLAAIVLLLSGAAQAAAGDAGGTQYRSLSHCLASPSSVSTAFIPL
jgi:hypothetical protein